eukprot:1203557-Prymnesium_polylepis.1
MDSLSGSKISIFPYGTLLRWLPHLDNEISISLRPSRVFTVSVIDHLAESKWTSLASQGQRDGTSSPSEDILVRVGAGCFVQYCNTQQCRQLNPQSVRVGAVQMRKRMLR